MDSSLNFVFFINVNEEVDLVVLGVNIIFIYLENKYVIFLGILMVIFYVVGVLVLLINLCEKEFGCFLIEVEIYV